MKKPKLDMSGKPIVPLQDSDFSRELPDLWDHLTSTQYSDTKEQRLTSTILIFVDGSSLKACLNDRDNSRSFFHTASTMEELLKGIDERLRDDTAEWKSKTSTQGTEKKIPW